MVASVVDPAKPGLGIDEFGLSGARATKIDELHRRHHDQGARCHLPESAGADGDPGAEVARQQPQGRLDHPGGGQRAVQAGRVRQAASHFLLKANEDYWGPNKPTIAEIKIVFRNEAAVRASMLQAGEVQLATLLTPEEAKQMPASLIELTGESVGIRINPEHPVLKDLRVRQAINMSIDRKSMIDALYGDVAEPLNGMMVRKSSLGWNPNLKEYPYDPAKAKQLIQEAGAVGQSIELISRNGVVPRVDEVTELFANQVSQTGLKVTVKSLEVGQWRTINCGRSSPARPAATST